MSTHTMTNKSWTAVLVGGALFVSAYFVLAYVAAPLRIESITASPVWLPHGMLVAAVLLYGPRFWPAVFVAVVLGGLSRGFPVSTTIGVGLVKTAEALAAVYLMRGPGRFTGTLDSVRNVVAFVLGGAALASMLGALLAVAFLSLSGLTPWSRFFEIAGTWWLGDAMGVLILVPVVLVFVTPRRWSFDRDAIVTLVLIGSTLFVACELAFGRLIAPDSGMTFAYLPFPLIFWAALRFGAHGAAISSSAAALFATIGTLRGLGPFVRESPVESLILLETFLAVMVVTGLILGAVICERRKVSQALRDSEKRHHLASSAGRVGVWDWDLATDHFYIDPTLKNILGYEDCEIPNTIERWRQLIHPEDLELVRSTSRRHLAGESPRFEIEHRMVHKDGSIRWFLARGKAQRDASGTALRLTGTDVDITRQKRAEEAVEVGEQKIREQLSELEHIY